MTASVYLPVAIAIERYMAVYYHPRLDQNSSCCRVLKYLIPVICLALVINIPKFLEAETYTYGDRVYLKPSDLRTHPDYILYNMWFRIIILGAIPMTLLMYFNIKIYQGIQRKQQQINLQHQQENNLASIFMTIVAVFCICHFPRVFLNFHEIITAKETAACGAIRHHLPSAGVFPTWALILNTFNCLFIVLNCCANFVIYGLQSPTFRRVVVKQCKKGLECFCHKCHKEEGHQEVEMVTMQTNY